MVRVVPGAEGLDRRVDLDRVDVLSPLGKGDRGVGAAARADDQHAGKLPAGEPAVHLIVEAVAGPVGREHRLVRYAVGVDGDTAVAGVLPKAVIGRPDVAPRVGPDRQHDDACHRRTAEDRAPADPGAERTCR